MARRIVILIPGAAISIALLLAVVTTQVAAGGGGCHAGIERDAEETTVMLTGNCMNPLIARVPVGAVVTFTNGDKQSHAITGAANRWGTYDDLIGGTSVAYRFTRTGVYPYFCYLHPGMIGAIVVGDGRQGGTGSSVQPIAPSARPTETPTETPSVAGAPATAGSTTGSSSSAGPTSLLTIGLLAVLLGAGAAYGFGLLPGAARARTRSR